MQGNEIKILLEGEELHLLSSKAIYWPKKQSLLLADLHLGKAMHFRKSGIAVPMASAKLNLEKLDGLLKKYRPECVCFLGDLFHSLKNSEWALFKGLLQSYPKIEFELILGNHDILHHREYSDLKLKTYENIKEVGPFVFSHAPISGHQLYNIAGHIHPSIRLKSRAKLSHTAACFVIGDRLTILPSFGNFTGSSIHKAAKGQRIFVIAENKLLEI